MSQGCSWAGSAGFLGAVLGLISIVFTAREAFKRRKHEKALEAQKAMHQVVLERVKGEVKREVEADLLREGTHLRIKSELRLSLHKREWELLREMQGAAFLTFNKVREFLADVLVERNPDLNADWAPWEGTHEDALEAHRKLSGLTRIAPPSQPGLPLAAEAFREAIERVRAVATKSDSADVVEAISAQNGAALEAMTAALSEWNAELWKTQAQEV